ncbi:MAG: multiheme c-type cytochrome, partial [Candidatus Binatia bacterium]
MLLAALATAGRVAAGAAPTHVGGATCAECHAQESALWKTSHHAQAMLAPNAETVRGNFADATFVKDGVTSTFFRRDGGYFVRTDGPDGRLHDYRVAYTFGIDPLQQYLIEMPGGRLQALGIAWDTRPAAQGGQRWFHLYPNEPLAAPDSLHWTGAQQNWNFMCADCHSTNLHKGYRAADDRFATTWSEVNVACEACHGPGAAHVAWARAGAAAGDPLRGFAFALGDRSGGAWRFAAGQSIARRTAPRSTDLEVETCGRCHARAARLRDDYVHGRPLADTHRVALLDPGLYHADGQIEDEVYEYGSFLQSPMHAAGVTCSDCHEPHSGRLRAEGNLLCGRCHLPATFDTAAHTHHGAGSAAAQCVSCHMPERTYMLIDGRRDHSFRVPRPDLSVRLGTPNACTDCHTDRSAQWAADAAAGWYGPARAARWHYAEALAAGRAQQADAETQLLRAIGDAQVPAIARASALELLASSLSPRALPALQAAARDPDPLVRRAAAQTAGALPPAERLGVALPLLSDPVRTVRLEALGSLLDAPGAGLTPE